MYFCMYIWGPLVDQLLPTFHSTDNLTQRPHQYSSMPSMAYAVSHVTLLYDNVMAQHLMVRTYYIPAQCNNITFSMHHFHIYYTHDATVIPQCNSTIPWCSSTVPWCNSTVSRCNSTALQCNSEAPQCKGAVPWCNNKLNDNITNPTVTLLEGDYICTTLAKNILQEIFQYLYMGIFYCGERGL